MDKKEVPNRVLIVEPDKVMAQRIGKKLSEKMDVVMAYSSQEAVTALDEYPCKVVVLEPMIQGNNGVEFLHELRSYNDWAYTPVYVYSMMAMPKGAQEALHQLGVVHWRTKDDYSLDEVIDEITRELHE